MPLEMLILIAIWFVIIVIPCVGIGFIGKRLINRLGKFPSKTSGITLNIMWKLIVIEVVSLTLILLFFKVFTTEL